MISPARLARACHLQGMLQERVLPEMSWHISHVYGKLLGAGRCCMQQSIHHKFLHFALDLQPRPSTPHGCCFARLVEHNKSMRVA